MNWGNQVYSVSSAKTAPLVLGAGSRTREAGSRASLEMGHEGCRVRVAFRTRRPGGRPWDEVRLRGGGLRTGTPAICQRHKQKREFGTSGSSLDYAVIDCAIYFKKKKGAGSNPAGTLVLLDTQGGVREWRHLLCIFFDLKSLSLKSITTEEEQA